MADREDRSPAGSRPPSAKKSSRASSRASAERPSSQPQQTRSSPVASPPAGSRPQSRTSPVASIKSGGSRPSSAKPKTPSSRAGSKASTAKSVSRPSSRQADEAVRVPSALDSPKVDSEHERSGQEAEVPDDTSRDQTSIVLSNPPMAATNNEGAWASQPTDDHDDIVETQTLTVVPAGFDAEDDLEDNSGLHDDDDGEGADDDDENELVVLDPDHPLMKRFQKALGSHLTKQNEKVTLELRELQEAVKNRKKERENMGVDLYGVQQELARHQMMLEKKHDDLASKKNERNQIETELSDVRDQYKSRQTTVGQERKKVTSLQSEVENLALRLFYMESAKKDVRSDISVMRRAAEKAESEVAKAEAEKQKQDLFVDRLVERADQLREEIAMYEAQLTAQKDETREAKDALNEAHIEIENIELEKKQLFQQWNSSLIGMRRRDEAHSAMMEALNQQRQRILSLETEIEGYKKSISKEQEENEKLTMVLNKTENDISTVRSQLEKIRRKHDALKNEYSTYTRMLHETEQALTRATTDKTLRLNEVNALRKQIEREFIEKLELEDHIMEMMRTKLTMEKGAQYTEKLTTKMRQRTKNLETQMAQVENEISRDILDASHLKTRIDKLKSSLKELDDDIAVKNQEISKYETQMNSQNSVIERKQGLMDQQNKKLEQMINNAGGEELGPLEIQINSLAKSIEAEASSIGELQQMWLRDQNELVRLTKAKDAQMKDVNNLKKKLTILTQKKLRIEAGISQQLNEKAHIERSTRNMQNDMLKLNTLIYKEQGAEHELQQGNVLMENDFIGALKEAERESIMKQEELDSLREEKERLLNSLVEAEKQIMLWEKKTQLARETRNAVDSEVGQGEIRFMRNEIHRMKVRHGNLMKQQERMIQEMEKSVSRRDTIVTRGDAQAKINKKLVTKGTFQRQLGELKKKIKKTIHDAQNCDGEIKELRESQSDLSSQLEEKQVNVHQLQGDCDALDMEIDRQMEHKHKGLNDLLLRQQRAKYYQQLRDGKYTRVCRNDSMLETETQKQIDKLQTMNSIIERLHQEFPHTEPSLRRIKNTLQNKIASD